MRGLRSIIAGAATLLGGICLKEKYTMNALPSGKVTQSPGTSVSLEENNPIDSRERNRKNILLSDFKSRFFKFGEPETKTLCFRKDYISLFDHRTKNPYCVIEHLTKNKEQLDDCSVRRKRKYLEDISVPELFRSTNSDYKDRRYEKGHMARADNHRHDVEAWEDTFYLSNMSPQIGVFNSGTWYRLEQHVKHFVISYENVYVCSGPLFIPKKESDGRLYVKYEVIGENMIAVPTHYFKVILGETEDGKFDMESYVMQHAAIEKDVPLRAFFVEKEIIEKYAGFQIFNDLPAYKVRKFNGIRSIL